MTYFFYLACQSITGKSLLDETPVVSEDLLVFSGKDGELFLGALLRRPTKIVPGSEFLTRDPPTLKSVEEVKWIIAVEVESK